MAITLTTTARASYRRDEVCEGKFAMMEIYELAKKEGETFFGSLATNELEKFNAMCGEVIANRYDS